MLYIYLPGFSTKNLVEADNICSAIRAREMKVYQHKWRNWQDDQIKWNIEEEVNIILEKINELNEQEYAVIGKSLGTLASVKIITYLGNKVNKVILLGIPINDIDQTDQLIYSKTLSSLKADIYIIQNNRDSHGSLEQVKEILKGVEYQFKVKNAEGHSYNYPDDIIEDLEI